MEKDSVGLRVFVVIFSTLLFVAGLTIGLLVTVPGLADAAKGAFDAPLAEKGLWLAVSVGLFLVGLWGIFSSRRRLIQAMERYRTEIQATKETIGALGAMVKR